MSGRAWPPESRRIRVPLATTAAVAALAYAVLTALVSSGRTRSLDAAAYQVFRPDGMWGLPQAITGNVVDGMQPRVLVPILLAVSCWSGWRRHSWRPVVLVLVPVLATGALVVGTKLVVNRVDPSGTHGNGSGSYPSGHAAFTLLCLVGIVILLRGGLRWWAWASVALLTTAMSVSLLFIGLHWLGDVLGGLLVAVAVTTGFGASPFGPELAGADARDHGDEPLPTRKPGLPA